MYAAGLWDSHPEQIAVLATIVDEKAHFKYDSATCKGAENAITC
jgi:hypothetical protein